MAPGANGRDIVGKRQYTNREWKLLSWWLATYHPAADIIMNARVGPVVAAPGLTFPAPPSENLLRVRNRWTDAIYIEGGALNLVEAKIDPDPGIFSQLIHYARKIRADPNFADFAAAPLNLVALVYNDDPSVAQEAPWYGVRWVVYQPNLAGFLPPSMGTSPLASIGSLLPQDWPARLQSWGIVSGGMNQP
jgi:hypothetical protein